MQFTISTFLAAVAALASAYTPANTAQPPSGNPIGHPEIGELIPAGQAYTITWTPDTGDRVTLLLLRGPSTNVVPILTIAENIPNTGSYIWGSVPTTLEPDTTGYGIQLIVESTGAYQYSPQCGVKNNAYTGAVSSGSSTVTTFSASTTATSSMIGSLSSMALTSSASMSYVTYASAPSAAGTAGNFSIPVVSPSKSMSVPATLQSSFTNTATRSSSSTVAAPTAVSTGGAANVVVNLAALMVAGVAGAVAL